MDNDVKDVNDVGVFLGKRNHSYRRASIGSFFAAFLAG